MNRDSRSQPDPLPPLYRDRSFYGMTVTQFLGAFNDNIFKQIVLLLLVHVVATSGGARTDHQALGQGLFALPFILFSGTSGWLSDRFRKRTIIVLCKVAEIVVMLCGMAAFATMTAQSKAPDDTLLTVGLPLGVLAVLFLMGTQSAVFGPSKYGILPEMVRQGDLPRLNGWIQMTTFLAIIFGTALAGLLNDLFNDRFRSELIWLFGESRGVEINLALDGKLWMAGGICVAIAVIGTLTSLLIRSSPPAQSGLPFRASNLAIPRDISQLLRKDRLLLSALGAYSMFWFVGGVVLPSLNALGKRQFGMNNFYTSLMPSCVGLGIALGCLSAGKLSAGRVSYRLVFVGTAGMIACLGLLAMPGPSDPQLLGYAGSLPVLTALGFFAGLYAVPLQVVIQIRPPESEKGRMIGAMNLMTWIAIFLTAPFYGGMNTLFGYLDLPPSAMFAATAVLLVPIIPLVRTMARNPASEEV